MVGENRVAKIMREWGMKARVIRVYRRMAKRRDDLKALPNFRLGADKPAGMNQQWSSDVTYIKLGKKYVFWAGNCQAICRLCSILKLQPPWQPAPLFAPGLR
jgi:transposase InsO family protein